MADKDMLDFLAGVKAYDADIEVRDDIVVAVATVGGPFAEYRSEEEHAAWIVEACHRAARRCETCAHYDGAEHLSICWTHDSHMPPDGFCSYYESKETADGTDS